jgi:hypothetical protein
MFDDVSCPEDLRRRWDGLLTVVDAKTAVSRRIAPACRRAGQCWRGPTASWAFASGKPTAQAWRRWMTISRGI